MVGFKLLQFAYVNTLTENFVICKFLSHISLEEKQKIIDKIRDLSKKNMAFPNGINNIFINNDKNNQLNAKTFQEIYLP